MLVIPNRSFFFIRSLQVWWPQDASYVSHLLQDTPLIDVMQCPDIVADSLESFSFRRRRFSTTLLDLSRSTEDLRSELSRTCRYQINKASRIDHDISIDTKNDDAYRMICAFARTYTRPPSRVDWQHFLSRGRVSSIRTDGHLIAAHVILVDPPERARLLFSATIDRADDRWQDLVGPLNRLLHWSEIEYFQRIGIQFYDFGGITADETSPLYPISRFKRSFGGTLSHENIIRLASRAWIRSSLSRATNIWRMVKRSEPADSSDGVEEPRADSS